MGRPLWLVQFVLLLQGAIVLWPPLLPAGWLAKLITHHYGLSHHSAAGIAILITLYILLVAAWIAGLILANNFWNARQNKRNNQ